MSIVSIHLLDLCRPERCLGVMTTLSRWIGDPRSDPEPASPRLVMRRPTLALPFCLPPVFDFFNNLNQFYGVVIEHDTPEACPTMSAGHG